eukprot:g4428.t1
MMSNSESTQKKKILQKFQNQRNNSKEFLNWSLEQDDFWLEGYEEKLKEIATNNYSTCQIECIDSKINCIQAEIEEIGEQIDAGWCGNETDAYDRFDAERILDGEEPLFKKMNMCTYKLKVLIPKIDLYADDDATGWCNLDFDIFDVYEVLSKEFVDYIMDKCKGKLSSDINYRQFVSLNKILDNKAEQYNKFLDRFDINEDCFDVWSFDIKMIYAKIISAEKVE